MQQLQSDFKRTINQVFIISQLLGTLDASLLGNLLSGKGVKSKIPDEKNYYRRSGFFMPPYPLIYFEIHKYGQTKPKFNGFYSTNNLYKIKDASYLINLKKRYSLDSFSCK